MIADDPAVNGDSALIFDGMAIKKETPYNPTEGQIEGFVDLGEGIEYGDDDTIASEALIFMLKALRSHWKYPIGYVLIDKIDAETLKCLVEKVFNLAVASKIKIRCVTCDGTATNFSTMKKLGCKIGDNLDGTFTRDGETCYFIPDMCHMLKLARNALDAYQVFIDGEGNKIEWRFIVSLHAEQSKAGLKYGNKLALRHIKYHPLMSYKYT